MIIKYVSLGWVIFISDYEEEGELNRFIFKNSDIYIDGVFNKADLTIEKEKLLRLKIRIYKAFLS